MKKSMHERSILRKERTAQKSTYTIWNGSKDLVGIFLWIGRGGMSGLTPVLSIGL
ncbi:hypothetical protein [Candidatus Methanoplasma termitum]|uniref:hypothetical protein n=1 Tax=Candidatus Methanoplasma termitum TaxID=1577791 RepID=UPI00130DCA60|nr:hypothetical protein [Candidatus Methanoplasma termitum]MCL2334119.1 hypothetical protein [Candidatus Methanoplasma sp.]